jgi:hypothetical protein
MDWQRIDRHMAGGTMARSVDSVAGMDLDEARALALALPEAHEAPHFDLTSFRVGKKVFATAPPDGDELRIFVDESETMACAEEAPDVFEELRWGQKLSGVRVTLSRADPLRVRELLEESWRRKAPKRLVKAFDADSGAG